jgi:hypothetical protein
MKNSTDQSLSLVSPGLSEEFGLGGSSTRALPPLLPLPFLCTRCGGTANGPAATTWPPVGMPGGQLWRRCAGTLGGISDAVTMAFLTFFLVKQFLRLLRIHQRMTRTIIPTTTETSFEQSV